MAWYDFNFALRKQRRFAGGSMKLTRRQFIASMGAMGLTGCARIKEPLERLTPDFAFGGKGPIAFAAINDPHLLDARSTALLNRAVGMINELPEVRFTVLLGDAATSGRLPELLLAKTCLDKLDQPWLAVPGNHDVEGRAVDPYGNYDRALGARQWVRDEGGWVFMGIDTCNGTASDVTLPPDRIDWIRERLDHLGKDKPIALLTHHPFNPNTKAYRVKNADEVLALFAEHRLRLVASGHYHGNQIEEQDGVLYVTTACCASTRGNFDETKEKGFRVFRLDGDSVSHEFMVAAAS
jgi:3',5'-cyclic AMP phosphodiesterase CpdA